MHGSFHSAWCFAEHFMPFFTRQGHDCYAVSLRGTAATGMPPGDPGETVRVDQHVSDLSFCLDTILKRGARRASRCRYPWRWGIRWAA